jgi:hypothetical protein
MDNYILFGLPLPVLVLLLVELLKKAKIVVTPDHARIANIAFSALGGIALVFVANLDSRVVEVLTLIVGFLYTALGSAITYNKTIGAAADKMKSEALGYDLPA